MITKLYFWLIKLIIKQKYPIDNCYMNIKQLKDHIKDLPDNGKVYLHLIENPTTIGTIKLPCPDYPKETDEYVQCWGLVQYNKINIYLTPHY